RLIESSPKANDNTTGFWEPADIVAIHQEVLASAGSAWDDVSPLSPAWFASDVSRKFRDRVVATLRRDVADQPLFVIKDPRMCRLVPFWRDVLGELGVELRFVLPVRHPLEVAASLAARDEF